MKKFVICFLALCIVAGTAFTAQALTFEEIDDAFKTYAKPFEKLVKKQDYKQIIKDGEELLQTGDDKAKFVALYHLAGSNTTIGDKEKALDAVNKMKKLDSDGVYSGLTETRIFLSFGEQDEALNSCLQNAQTVKKEYSVNFKNFCMNTIADFNKVSAKEIWNAFNENEVAAEDKYQNRYIAVEGKISKISTSITGAPELTMNVDQYGLHTIVFDFSNDDRPEIAKLKKGEKMKIAGKCRIFVMGLSLRFTDCWIMD